MHSKLCLSLLILFVALGKVHTGFGQSYGLGFNSYEVVPDQRTGLILSPDRNLCISGSFELSFQMSFFAHQKNYFGYVFRIIEDGNRNIDLVYDNSDSTRLRFQVVIGSTLSSIAFNIPEDRLFGKWNSIHIRFDEEKNSLTLTCGAVTRTSPLPISAETCFKVLFGAVQDNNFGTTDLPPMKIRNIRLTQNENLLFHWPLNEMDGSRVQEVVKGKDASVYNPLWIRKMHFSWQPLKKFTMDGPARVAFNSKEGIVYMVGRDTLIKYSVSADQLAYVRYPRQSLYMDNQVLYGPSRNKIYNIYPNEQQVTEFDLSTNQWNRTIKDSSVFTRYLHANKFLAADESSIYLLGGYGQLAYRNSVQKYDIKSGTWELLPEKDSLFMPRYLGGLGRTEGGAYLLGGYGSVTGKQTLNPGSWHDLLFYTPQNNSFELIYRYEEDNRNSIFANSMVIQEKDTAFYALTFPKDKFNTELQMIRGSLVRPGQYEVGSAIPFQFLDTHSYADLFFDKNTHRFVAVTLYRTPQQTTEIAIYSLYDPPLTAKPDPQEASLSRNPAEIISIVAIVLALIVGPLLYFRFKNVQVQNAKYPVPQVNRMYSTPKAQDKTQRSAAPLLPPKNCIFLFGNFQVYSEKGREITGQFTPLLKELFLILLIYSTRLEGVSSEKLTELLWSDKSTDSARNNRSVNLNKLRSILSKLDYCSISKESGYWRIDMDFKRLNVDYANYLLLTANKRNLSRSEVEELAGITNRGNFLSGLEYEWLDRFKGEVSSEIIDAYLRYIESINPSDDPDLVIRLANSIFQFDLVNEEAMIMKCKALAHLGNHSLAQTTFENFTREYHRIYGEEYKIGMRKVLDS